ncbi:hypothetical protein [Haloferula sp. BvORR071]|uniref:hypothetical protein n=1 Tax=Haloferula sp. BvORR071 TaxID=1396141 RepID=UPI0005522FF0|nr:hypothetical protein [Haloferula sp. BvORR071]
MTLSPIEERVMERPENCEVGDRLLPQSVPHWDGGIRLVEFTPAGLKPGEKPWMFAASYKGMETIGWKRVE